MDIEEQIDKLFFDIFKELTESSAFQSNTIIGYDLIEEKYQDNLKKIERDEHVTSQNNGNRLASLNRIRLRYSNLSISEKREAYIIKINKSVIIYACSLFDYYLNQCLKILYTQYPAPLASEKKVVPYHELVRKTKEEIVDAIIDKEIYEVSYKRIDERIQYLSTKFDLDLEFVDEEVNFFTSKINKQDLIDVFATRNLIVHNNDIINEIFLQLTKSPKHTLGTTLGINEVLVMKVSTVLTKAMTSIHRQIEMRYF